MNEEKNNIPAEEAAEEVNLSELLQLRRDKLEELRREGHDPFVLTSFDQDNHAARIVADFEQLEGKDVAIAGRIMTWRDMGKASFIDLQDGTGRIQVYIRINDVGEEAYAAFRKWDVGDVIGVKGFVFRTRRGEISVHAKEIVLLAKSLRPLPDKYPRAKGYGYPVPSAVSSI